VKVICLSGDGIGPEVMREAIRALRALPLELEERPVAEMATHLFGGLDTPLRNLLTGDTILVPGENVGTGSSRENVPIPCREAAAAARTGSRMRIDPETGAIEGEGERHAGPALPPFMLERLRSGGLVPRVGGQLEPQAGGGAP